MKIGFSIEGMHLYGGTTRSIFELATHLPGDPEIVFLVRKSEIPDSKNYRCEIVEPGGGLPILRQLTFAWKTSRRGRQLKLDILNAGGICSLKQDVITAHSVHKRWFLHSLGALSILSRAFWLKILNPFHYIAILIETYQYLPRNHRHVIAISQQVKNDLITQFRIDPARISVIHHGVNLAEFSPRADDTTRAKVRQSVQLAKDDYVAVFVAHEFRRKGLGVLLKAFKQADIPHLKLLVIGQDDPGPFLAEIASNGLKDRIMFLGLQKNIADWYAASDVFAFPTSYEAFGLVITEAMAAGLPVIVPQNAGAAELLTNDVEGVLLSKWDDVDELANALRRLQDPVTRKRMGVSARKTAEVYTWERAAKLTYNLYERLLADKASKRL